MTAISLSAALSKFIIICGGFTAICVAGGWLIKIIKGVGKPVDDINEKLKNDKVAIDNLTEKMDEVQNELNEIRADLKMVTNTLYHLLKHAQTSNNTGGMAKCEKELFEHMNK